GGGGHSSSC
ncbi:chlamydia polymorphic membrane middle domain protein, partial [Chlamydia psittaci C1/97]